MCVTSASLFHKSYAESDDTLVPGDWGKNTNTTHITNEEKKNGKEITTDVCSICAYFAYDL